MVPFEAAFARLLAIACPAKRALQMVVPIDVKDVEGIIAAVRAGYYEGRMSPPLFVC